MRLPLPVPKAQSTFLPTPNKVFKHVPITMTNQFTSSPLAVRRVLVYVRLLGDPNLSSDPPTPGTPTLSNWNSVYKYLPRNGTTAAVSALWKGASHLQDKSAHSCSFRDTIH